MDRTATSGTGVLLGLFFVYLLSLYVWYSTTHGRSFFVAISPYLVQAIVVGHVLKIARSSLAPLFLFLNALIFSLTAAIFHLVAGDTGVAVDWPGLANFHLVFFVQFFISISISVFIWLIVKTIGRFFRLRKWHQKP